MQTKFGVVLGKLTIRYSGVDGHPNDDHSESVPGCWHSTFFKTIVLLRYVNSSYTFLVNFKSVGRRTVQLLDRLPWQPEVKTESFNFLNVWTTFATGDKSNLHQRGNFDTLSKKKSCLKGGERKLLIFRLGSRTNWWLKAGRKAGLEGLRQTSHSAGHWHFLPPFFFCGCWCKFFFNAPLFQVKSRRMFALSENHEFVKT